MRATLPQTVVSNFCHILPRLFILGLLSAALPTPAADIFWINQAGGDWMLPANWSSNTVPGPADRAVLNLNVTVSLNAPAAVSGLALSNGTFTVTSALTVTTNMDWMAGTLNGTGTVALAQNATLTLAGATKSFGQTTINNAGLIRWTSGDIWSGSGATITNRPGALFDIQADVSWFFNEGGLTPLLLNAGTVQKSAGSANTALGMFLQNNGSFLVQSGTVNLYDGGDAQGAFNVGSGATLVFSSASMLLETNSSLTASGAVAFTGGTVDINGFCSISGSALINGGTANFNSPASARDLALSLGVLGGTGILTISNSLNWTGGTMVGPGTTLIPPGATLSLAGGVKGFAQRTIDNASVITWTAGDIWSGSAATITNRPGAFFDIQADVSWLFNEGGPTPLLLNAGTFQKSSGSGNTTLGIFVENNGSFFVQSGTVNLYDGGDAHGAFNVAAGATLAFTSASMLLETNSSLNASGTVAFTGGTVDINGFYSASSSTLLNGATANFNSPAFAHDLALSAGVLGGTGILTISNSLNWTGGAMVGPGTTLIPSGATLSLAGAVKAFAQRTIDNAGSIIWTAGDIWSGSAASITNRPGALFDIQADVNWLFNEGGLTPLLLNVGTFQKSSGSGNTTLGIFVQNNGSFLVRSGTVNLYDGGDAHGAFNVASGATLAFTSANMLLETNSSLNASGTVAFTGGTIDINGACSLAGSSLINGATANFNSSASAHDLALSSGVLSGTGTLIISNSLNWTGGTMLGPGLTLISSTATLSLAGGVKGFAQRTIDNAGAITWTSGDFWSGSAATITNRPGALFDIQADVSWLFNEGGPTPLLLNSGTFQKSSGSAVTTIGAFVQNDATLAVQSGALSLAGAGDAHGQFTVQSGCSLSFPSGHFVLETNSSVAGAGTVGFSGATVDVNGAFSLQGASLITSGTANFNSAATTRDATFSSGILSGSGTFTVTNAMSWSGGQLAGSGATTIAAGATLALTGGTKIFTQRTLNNAGTLQWTSGDLWSGIGATLNNLPGALLDLQADQPWAFNEGGAPPVLNNAGTLQKTAGSGSTTLSVLMTNSGTISLQTGTLNLNGPNFANQTNGLVQGIGILDISHTTVTADGGFSPGSPLGALRVIGSLPQSSSGHINIELGGASPGLNFDRLIISGTATLRGALNVSLVNGFKPNGGDTFEIMTFASSTGTFDNISGLNLSTNFYLEPAFNGTNLVLTAIDNRPHPKFSPLQLQPDGSIHSTLTGIAGQTFVIQASTNFLSWQDILTNENAGAVFDFVFPDTSKYRYRFFRTVQQ